MSKKLWTPIDDFREKLNSGKFWVPESYRRELLGHFKKELTGHKVRELGWSTREFVGMGIVNIGGILNPIRIKPHKSVKYLKELAEKNGEDKKESVGE